MPAYICPNCKNPIYDDQAVLCLYCGESLKRAVGVMGNLKYTRPRIIGVIIASIILLSFVLLLLKR